MQIEDGLYLRLKHLADVKQVPVYDLIHTILNLAVSYEEWTALHDTQRLQDLQDTLEAIIIASTPSD